MRVDRDAMSTYASRRREWHVAERLRCCSARNLEAVDRCGKCPASVKHLVRVSYANHALAIFVQLRHFSDFWRGNGNDIVEDGGIEPLDGAQRAGGNVIETRYDFWDSLERRRDASRVNTLKDCK